MARGSNLLTGFKPEDILYGQLDIRPIPPRTKEQKIIAGLTIEQTFVLRLIMEADENYLDITQIRGRIIDPSYDYVAITDALYGLKDQGLVKPILKQQSSLSVWEASPKAEKLAEHLAT